MRRAPLIAATILSIAALSSCAAPAYAASDSPTPYSVTVEGVTLPAGVVFSDNDHINIRATAPHIDLHFEAKCITRTDAECAGAPHDAAQFIGQSFIPWTAFGLVSDYCVVWIQIAGFDEHYGESGQPPVCSPSTPPEKTEPTPSPTTPTTSPTPTLQPETPTSTSVPAPVASSVPTSAVTDSTPGTESTSAPSPSSGAPAPRLADTGVDNDTAMRLTIVGFAALFVGLAIGRVIGRKEK